MTMKNAASTRRSNAEENIQFLCVITSLNTPLYGRYSISAQQFSTSAITSRKGTVE